MLSLVMASADLSMLSLVMASADLSILSLVMVSADLSILSLVMVSPNFLALSLLTVSLLAGAAAGALAPPQAVRATKRRTRGANRAYLTLWVAIIMPPIEDIPMLGGRYCYPLTNITKL